MKKSRSEEELRALADDLRSERPSQPGQPSEHVRVDLNLVIHLGDNVTTLFKYFKLELEHMANKIQAALDKLAAQVTANTTVTGSAAALVNSIPQLIAAGIAAAIDAGATPEQLQQLSDLADKIGSDDTGLAAAVAANTSAAPPADGGGDTGTGGDTGATTAG